MLIKELLIESIDWYGSDAYVTIGNEDYILRFMQMSEGDFVHSSMPEFPIDDNTYFLAFALNHKTRGLMDTDANNLGLGEVMHLFNVLKDAFIERIKETNADILYFGCENNHPIRRRLYQKLVDIFTKLLGWKVVGSGTYYVAGSDKFMWVIRKTPEFNFRGSPPPPPKSQEQRNAVQQLIAQKLQKQKEVQAKIEQMRKDNNQYPY